MDASSMISRSIRASVTLLLLLGAAAAAPQGLAHDINGHAKLQMLGQSFPDGDESLDVESDLRLNVSLRRKHWTFDTAYELVALHGDNVAWLDDAGRLLNLSDIIREQDKTIIAQRLDRLWLGYASEKAVVRIGRQALTWGNGFFFTPMDLVNPFSPAAIDTEFKTGDDMLYAQYLRDNGADLQAAIVVRRDPNDGEVASNLATTALKYHGFAGDNEFDVLLAESYGERVIGVGGARSIGGAILRGDLVVTESSGTSTVQLVSNLSYAWDWGGRNVNSTLEYFYNDGTDYFAAALLIELSPLWSVTPTLLTDASHRSALLQLVSNYSLSDNMRLLGSLNLPIGASDAQAGAPQTGIPGQFLVVDWSVFAQFAWYFQL